MGLLRISRSSDLAASAEAVLPTLTLYGVNAELRPLVRMTAPAEWARRSLDEWPQRRVLFHSYILLLGVLPVDRHAFYLQSVRPGEGFQETSTSLLNAAWNHERTINPIDGGCRVTDRVEYRSRIAVLGWLLKPLYQLVFWNRHRNLALRFGVLG